MIGKSILGMKLFIFLTVPFLRVYSQYAVHIITKKHFLSRFLLVQHMVARSFRGLKGFLDVKIEGEWSFFAA